MHVFILSWLFVSICYMDSLCYVRGVYSFFWAACCFFQGFLAKDLQAEALNKLDHRVKVAAEQFMKILEEIDALVILIYVIYLLLSNVLKGVVCNTEPYF